MTDAQTARLAQVWDDAQFALVALQLDPVGLGGIWLQAGHGPVRDAWLHSLHHTGIATTKVPTQTDEERLLGGMDLAQTLQLGRLVQQPGLLAQADGGAIVLPMAERLSPHTVAHIAQALDRRTVQGMGTAEPQPARFAAIALDESEPDEPGIHAGLSDRLGIWLNLHEHTLAHTHNALDPLSALERTEALALLQHLAPTAAQVQALCETAAALGVDSLRAPLMALRLAAVRAALEGRSNMDDDDLALGARMVLGPRATRIPERAANPDAPPPDSPPPDNPDAAPEPEPPGEPPEPQAPPESADMAEPPRDAAESPPEATPDTPAAEPSNTPPEPNADVLLAAALASLPPRLLDRLLLGQTAKTSAGGAGSSGLATRSKLRGRPLTPRPGKPGSGARLHVLATLRAAAPKQRLRQPAAGSMPGTTPGTSTSAQPRNTTVRLRAEDFHVQRFAQRSPSCLIFALDASGSAALQRLAEAKGAVELLLQDSYARRDSVCVIAFRGASAQVLLPPTRSLVRAKRALVGLPGGGGTPLASGLRSALQQAQALQRAGSTPMLVMLSDGRANVTAAGVGGRAQAQADALAWAAQWQRSGFAALWIDTAAQPEPLARSLAQQMGAHYVPMPYVQAQRMAHVVQDLAAATRKA